MIAMASAQGRTVKVITEDPAGGYFRSDHFNFVKKGVPTILVGGGKDYVDKARHEAKPKFTGITNRMMSMMNLGGILMGLWKI